MKWLKKPAVAWAIAVVVIACGTLLSANRSFGRLYDQVEKAWSDEETGVRPEMESKIKNAANLAVVAGRYVSEDETRPMQDAAAALRDAIDSPKDAKAASRALTDAVLELETVLGEHELTERDEDYVRGLTSEELAADQRAGHSEYNTACETYEKALKRFPANLLSKVTGAETAEPFDNK